jgi:hypothetical protein
VIDDRFDRLIKSGNNYNIKNILHLIVTTKTFLSIFEVLGIPLSLKKTVGQFNTIEYLGIYLDSDKIEARLQKKC